MRTRSSEEVAQFLRQVYERRGYFRAKIDRRQGGRRSGWEVRLFAADRDELRQIRQALRALNLKPGRPFAKRSGYIVPVYGLKQVESFLKQVRPKVKADIPYPPSQTS